MVENNDRLTLTRSLEAEVRAAFAVPTRPDGLNHQSLLSALESVENNGLPLAEALHEAGFMPPLAEDQAVLDWVDAVFEQWSRRYPMAPELQQIVQRARPHAAASALLDDRFFVPGAHALHRLLDVIHNGLIGWYAALGPAASNALEGAKEALERARRDFPSEPQVDETLELLSQKIHAHDAQLTRLNEILVEREIAAMGPNIARLAAVTVINELLIAHQVPGSVARFIKSDWYESGVLIAAQQGLASDAWRAFIDTTQLLVEAVQPVDLNDGAGQSRLQATMQQLPTTLSRQLLSLAPDNDAIAGAVGLIEYALLRNMRGEDLGLLHCDPIVEHDLPEGGPPMEWELTEIGLEPGAWFALDTPEGEVRIRFAGSFADRIYLVFMNFLGARAQRKSFGEFKALVTSGEARRLEVSDSFCRAMVEATEAYQQEKNREAEHAAMLAGEAARLEAQEQAEMAKTLRGEADAARYREQEANQSPADHPPANPRGNSTDSLPSSDKPYEGNTVVKLQIPMGTWMGFHDRDPPLMAKVAVRDLEKDSYIFTNRDGIKLRELTVAQLIALIDRDMVDILERKTNFRDTVSQMRRDQERLANA